MQAVYIATLHPSHPEWAIKCAQAGKHVLCEKPLAMNHGEAMAVVETARESNVLLMEAFMYRCHPQTHRIVKLVRDERAIGDVRMIRASFCFCWPRPFDPSSRLLHPALGGGGILDVGCYPVSFARLMAGVATGEDFAEPIDVGGAGHLGSTGVDEWAIAALRFKSDIVAQLACGVQVPHDTAARIDGADGSIIISNPWAPARDGGRSTILVRRHDDKQPREIVVETPQPIYAVEADAFADAVATRRIVSPAMSNDDSLGNMRTLDRWRAAIGLQYDLEKPEYFPHQANFGRRLPPDAPRHPARFDPRRRKAYRAPRDGLRQPAGFPARRGFVRRLLRPRRKRVRHGVHLSRRAAGAVAGPVDQAPRRAR